MQMAGTFIDVLWVFFNNFEISVKIWKIFGTF